MFLVPLPPWTPSFSHAGSAHAQLWFYRWRVANSDLPEAKRFRKKITKNIGFLLLRYWVHGKSWRILNEKFGFTLVRRGELSQKLICCRSARWLAGLLKLASMSTTTISHISFILAFIFLLQIYCLVSDVSHSAWVCSWITTPLTRFSVWFSYISCVLASC